MLLFSAAVVVGHEDLLPDLDVLKRPAHREIPIMTIVHDVIQFAIVFLACILGRVVYGRGAGGRVRLGRQRHFLLVSVDYAALVVFATVEVGVQEAILLAHIDVGSSVDATRLLVFDIGPFWLQITSIWTHG